MGPWSGILFLFLLSFGAQATSTLPVSTHTLQSKKIAPRCEAQARFLSPLHRDQKVYWKFEIQKTTSKNQGACPRSGEVEIFILSAEYVEKINAYVYPGYVVQPKVEKNYLITINKDNDQQWVVADWQDGIRPLP